MFIVYDHCNNCQCDRTLCTTVFWKYKSDIAMYEYICIFNILYSSYPRMYPSHPLNVSITIRINENAHFLTVTCYMIPEALTIISTMCMILLSDYVFPLASLNMENPGIERQAFFSLSKYTENMNHQCECVAPCKLSKESCPAILNLTMFM